MRPQAGQCQLCHAQTTVAEGQGLTFADNFMAPPYCVCRACLDRAAQPGTAVALATSVWAPTLPAGTQASIQMGPDQWGQVGISPSGKDSVYLVELCDLRWADESGGKE